MRPIIFPKPRTIEMLSATASQDRTRVNERRQRVGILVIDDNSFEPRENLTNHGFHIEQMLDITSIKQTEAYPVVLCDLQGVGKSLSATLQGAQIIKEIRKSYPDKIVIAYTGGSQLAAITRTASLASHYFLAKDERIEKWVEVLDEAIQRVSDPVHVWKAASLALLESGASIFQVMLIEDAYVKLNGSSYEKASEVFKSLPSTLGLSPNPRSVVENMVASATMKLVFGI